MKKIITNGLYSLAIAALFAACAEDNVASFSVPKPEGYEQMVALNSYDVLKNYVDRAKYPNLQLTAAVGGEEFLKGELAYVATVSNFDALALKNTVSHAAFVAEDGSMNPKPLTDVLTLAEKAGIATFGPALACNTQQNAKWLNARIADEKYPHTPEHQIDDVVIDYSQMDAYPYTETVTNGTVNIVNGVLTATPQKNKSFSYSLVENIPTKVGAEYELVFEVKASKEASVSISVGNYSGKFNATDEWATFVVPFVATEENTAVQVKPGRLSVTLEYTKARIYHYYERLRTPEEKCDTLTLDMQRWVATAMEACGGKVSAWELISNPLADDGDVEGYYDLCHQPETASDNEFYWQDYFGSENYGAVVEKAAREAYAANGGNASELKLYVTETGLDNDEDDNHRLASLIYWVGQWENHGAKIDGLGTQLHLTCYEDRDVMASKAAHVVKMLHTMADTKKLVRIAELDMTYVNAEGIAVKPAELTAGQQKSMADYYRFVVQMYLKIVPAAQQGGICMTSLADTANSPVGLWTKDWERKQAYAAVCDALSQPLPQTEDFLEYIK